MKNTQKIRKKGGYSDQKIIIRFRSSVGLHKKLEELAYQQGLCLAGTVRRLILIALDEFNA